MGYKLKNIKKEDIKIYKDVFTEGNYIKFLELLRDLDSKSEVEINKIHKELIVDTLIRQRKRLRMLLKDKTSLVKHINTIISIGNTLQPLLRRFNELSKTNDIHRIIDVSNEELIKETKLYLGGGMEEESDEDQIKDLFEYLILHYGLESEKDNVFYIAYHMDDILEMMDEKVSKLVTN